MEISKKVCYSLQYPNQDVAAVSLFFAFAYFAGKNREIQVFKTAQLNGLMMAATTASVGLGVARQTVRSAHGHRQSLQEHFFEIFIVAMTCILLTPLVAKSSSKVEIFPADCRKFALCSSFILGGIKARDLSFSTKHNGVIDPMTLERDMEWIEGIPRHRWKLSENVNAFDLDGKVENFCQEDVLKGKKYQALYRIRGKEIKGDFHLLEQRLYKYTDGYGLDKQECDLKWYINKLLGYLVLKQREIEITDVDEATLESFENLVATVLTSIVDAHRDCADQCLSQIKTLALAIIEDMGASTPADGAALHLEKYRDALIKECVLKSLNSHQADAEVDLSLVVQKSLALPKSRVSRQGARYNWIYNPLRFFAAKKRFFYQYDPIAYLVRQMTEAGGLKLFNDMCRDFQSKLVDASPGDETHVHKLLGFDPTFIEFDEEQGIYRRKDSAVLYYLYKIGAITL